MYQVKVFRTDNMLVEDHSYESTVAPVKGDVILYNDGTMYEVERRVLPARDKCDIVLVYVNPLT